MPSEPTVLPRQTRDIVCIALAPAVWRDLRQGARRIGSTPSVLLEDAARAAGYGLRTTSPARTPAGAAS